MKYFCKYFSVLFFGLHHMIHVAKLIVTHQLYSMTFRTSSFVVCLCDISAGRVQVLDSSSHLCRNSTVTSHTLDQTYSKSGLVANCSPWLNFIQHAACVIKCAQNTNTQRFLSFFFFLRQILHHLI